jgi:hypothetical protein
MPAIVSADHRLSAPGANTAEILSVIPRQTPVAAVLSERTSHKLKELHPGPRIADCLPDILSIRIHR